MYGGIFLLSLCLSFGISRYWKNYKQEPNQIISEPGPDTTNVPPVRSVNVKIIVDEVQKKGNKYVLRVHGEDIPEGMSVLYRILENGIQSENGYFDNLPPSKFGKYTVAISDVSVDTMLVQEAISGFDEVKIEPSPAQDVMSSSEFQALLLNPNDYSILGGKNPKVARSVSIRVQGLKDDRAPGDIQSVRDKIANGIWQSARVANVGYDNSGRINSVVLQPIYPSEE